MTHRAFIVSDIHFDNHHDGAIAALEQAIKHLRPTVLVVDGDLVDLGSLSVKYDMAEDEQVHAIDQVAMAVEWLNNMREFVGRIVIIPGNHEERWEKLIFGKKAPMLKGAKGLTLREQFYAQGLHESIRWVSESKHVPGVWLGKQAVLVRHGHKQARGFGAVDIAGKMLREVPGISQVIGHHHRAQLRTQTVFGRTVFAIANPHLSGEHDYSVHPDWQRGFTILEFYGRKRMRDCVQVSPHLVIMDSKGRFSYGGKQYGF